MGIVKWGWGVGHSRVDCSLCITNNFNIDQITTITLCLSPPPTNTMVPRWEVMMCDEICSIYNLFKHYLHT